MGGSQRGYAIEVAVVIMLGLMWFSSFQIQPTWAQKSGCWDNINKCIQHNLNDPTNPKFNMSSPSYNVTEYLCCPLVQNQAQSNKQCFCSISAFVRQNPVSGRTVARITSICGVTKSDSLSDLEEFCAGVVPAPAEAPTK